MSTINEMKKEKLFAPVKSNKNILLYPCILKCCDYIKDDFWKTIFENMSYGKCPGCIYISNNTVYSSNKKKSFSFIIDEKKHPKDLFLELRDIIMKNTALCSSADTKLKKDKISEDEEKDKITSSTTWTEIRRKNTKEIIIIRFVLRMKSKYKLTWDATKDLYSLINIGLLSKTQTSKDIIFKDKRIQTIEGIEYNGNGNFINKFSTNIIDDEKEDKEENDKYLYYYWYKYVSSVSKAT